MTVILKQRVPKVLTRLSLRNSIKLLLVKLQYLVLYWRVVTDTALDLKLLSYYFWVLDNFLDVLVNVRD